MLIICSSPLTPSHSHLAYLSLHNLASSVKLIEKEVAALLQEWNTSCRRFSIHIQDQPTSRLKPSIEVIIIIDPNEPGTIRCRQRNRCTCCVSCPGFVTVAHCHHLFSHPFSHALKKAVVAYVIRGTNGDEVIGLALVDLDAQKSWRWPWRVRATREVVVVRG